MLFAVSNGALIGGVAVPDETLTIAPEIAALREWHDIDVIEPPLEWGLLIGHADAPERFNVVLGSGK